MIGWTVNEAGKYGEKNGVSTTLVVVVYGVVIVGFVGLDEVDVGSIGGRDSRDALEGKFSTRQAHGSLRRDLLMYISRFGFRGQTRSSHGGLYLKGRK